MKLDFEGISPSHTVKVGTLCKFRFLTTSVDSDSNDSLHLDWTIDVNEIKNFLSLPFTAGLNVVASMKF